jgi:DGQHR domain-containing protein
MEDKMVARTYFGCKVAQRGIGKSVEFVVFMASAKDVLMWSGIRRVGKHDRGMQRVLKEARTRAIKRFFESNTSNTIPGSALIAFDPGVAVFHSLQENLDNCTGHVDTHNNINDKIEWGYLAFEFQEGVEDHLKPALIVDGQHRLNGMVEVKNEDLPLPIIALLDANAEEQAFQFVVINSKAVKVPPDNVKAIVASQFNETNLQDRLLKAGVNFGETSAVLKDIDSSENSPFYQMLKWPLNSEDRHIIQLTTIENCLRYIRSQFPVLEEDEDTLKEIFLSIWRTTKLSYPDLWTSNKKFLSKVNINALNEFITDRLSYAWEGDLVDIFDQDQVVSQTKNILSLIPKEFWERDWLFKIQDNTFVRGAIKEDLRTISQNTRARNAWDENLKLVGQNGD